MFSALFIGIASCIWDFLTHRALRNCIGRNCLSISRLDNENKSIMLQTFETNPADSQYYVVEPMKTAFNNFKLGLHYRENSMVYQPILFKTESSITPKFEKSITLLNLDNTDATSSGTHASIINIGDNGYAILNPKDSECEVIWIDDPKERAHGLKYNSPKFNMHKNYEHIEHISPQMIIILGNQPVWKYIDHKSLQQHCKDAKGLAKDLRNVIFLKACFGELSHLSEPEQKFFCRKKRDSSPFFDEICLAVIEIIPSERARN